MSTEVTITQLAELSAQQPEALLARLKQANVSIDGINTPLTPKQKEAVVALLRPTKSRNKGKLTLSATAKEPTTTNTVTPSSPHHKSNHHSNKVKVTIKKAMAVKKPSVAAPKPAATKKPKPAPAVPDAAVDTQTPIDEKPEKRKQATSPSEPTPPSDNIPEKATSKPTKNKTSAKTEYLLKQDFEARKNKHRRKKSGQSRAAKNAPTLKQDFTKPTKAVVHTVSVPENIRLADLAKKMSLPATEVIKTMMGMGAMVTINQMLDQDTAMLVVEEMGHQAVKSKEINAEEALFDETLAATSAAENITKAPVVAIMGHVDHGKTSLLDYIRTSQVANQEAGGITQHIGAYQISTPQGYITFLDTPGHEAFTAMRARGAQCTDIVILVVAADDGVMPQTIEAIQHAKAAKVPMIVAINKMDKPEADPEPIKNALAAQGVAPEDWGGDTIYQPISAKTGQGVDRLLESISLQAEVLELKAPIEGRAKGVVIESRLDRGRGVVATLLMQSGTLRKGDYLLAGKEYGRIRTMLNDGGQSVQSAGPAIPIEVMGLSNTPNAGDECLVVADEKRAREVALFRQGRYRAVKLARQQSAKLENMFNVMKHGETNALNIILKTDVQGSLEAIVDSLNKLNTDEVKVQCVGSGVGGIHASDVQLAMASSAIIIGFNVRADQTAKALIEKENIDLHYYSVIYHLIDEVRAAMSGLLAPEIKEEILGVAAVKDVFHSSKWGAIAGCQITSGTIPQGSKIRVLRDDIVIFTGELESLRHFKEDLKEAKYGTECGIGVKNYNDIKHGDQIESYQITEHKRQLA